MTKKTYIGLLVILLLSAFYMLPAQATTAGVVATHQQTRLIRALALPDDATIMTSDWVVTGIEVHEDEVIVLTGNLVVEPGGNLTLVNCTLLMNCTCPEEFGITVEEKGVLKVVGGSNITALWLSLGLRFQFDVGTNATVFFKDSFFSGFSYLDMAAENAVMENCTLSGPAGIHAEAPYNGAVLVIRNCSLEQCPIYIYDYEGAVIEDNKITGSWAGVELAYCSNCEVTGNEITGCYDGVRAYRSDGTVVRGNTITGNGGYGVYLGYSDNVVVEDNYIAGNGDIGLCLSGCTGVIVRRNTLLNDGLLISGFWQEHYDSHTITDNTVNGKPIYYVVGASGYTVPSGAGEVIVASSSSVLVKDLSFSGTDVGVIAAFSEDVDIVGVEASSLEYAIRCIECRDVNMTGVHVEDTDYAIDISDCDDVLLNHVVVSGGYTAIDVDWTDGITVLDSEIGSASYGIYCDYCDHITVVGCVIEDCDMGLVLDGCEDMAVEDCVFIKDGIYVEGYRLSKYMFTSFSNNTVNGKPIYYVASTSGYTIPSDAGQVIIVNSTGITVDGVNASYTDVGILVAQSKGVTIRNAVLEHDDYGILMVLGCEGITVQDGQISGCGEGISARDITGLTAQGLEITGCDHGIYVHPPSSDVTITGCTMSDCHVGIEAWFVEGIMVSNCDASGCFSGIYIVSSDGVSVLNCHLTDNSFGIYCHGCDGVVVKGNEVSDSSELGLCLDYCENMTVTDNAFTGDGIGLEGYEKEHFMIREFSNNTVNGKPIYYVVNSTGYTVPSGAGQVIIVNSTGIVVSGLTITDTDIAIIVAFSRGVSISGCTLEDNSRHGLYCYEAEVSVEDTTVADSMDEGIYCEEAVLSVERCNITGNDDAGIHVEDGVLNVAGTYITDNTGYGIGGWDANVTLTACVISGNDYEGVYMFSWMASVAHVENCTISHNWQGIFAFWVNLTVIRCEVMANEYNGIICSFCPSVEVHDSSIYSNGGYGLYAYRCTVNATGNWWNSTTGPELTFMPPDEVDPEEVWACFGTIIYKPFLTAPPYIPPVDTEPPSLAITEPSEGAILSGTVVIKADASDPSGVANVTFYIDGTAVSTDTEAPYEYEWDTTAYADGSHTIKVEAYDTYGNKAEASITVTVDNTPPDIGTPSISPEEPVEGEDVTVSVNVTDATSCVAEVILSYSTDGGATWTNVTMTAAMTYEATIPGQPAGTEVLYKIYARDTAGNWAVSAQYSYTVKAKAAPPGPPGPAVPPTIAGIPTMYVIGGAVGAIIVIAALAWAIRRRRF